MAGGLATVLYGRFDYSTTGTRKYEIISAWKADPVVFFWRNMYETLDLLCKERGIEPTEDFKLARDFMRYWSDEAGVSEVMRKNMGKEKKE